MEEGRLLEGEKLEKDLSGTNNCSFLLKSAVWSTVSLSGAGCGVCVCVCTYVCACVYACVCV